MADEINGKELWFKLGGIEKGLATVIQTLGEDRIASASYRTDIRKELATARESLLMVTLDVKVAKDAIDQIKPVVASLSDARTRSLGVSSGMETFAVWLGRIAHVISALIGGVFAVLVSKWIGK